jgi:wyosine [tRNA(Phe)-imidazoG37] synthetase (radical SAM superfamily)
MTRNLPLQTGIIYGPVSSRRLGRSLGINLSPTGRKICSFNCVYCHYGWTRVLTGDLSGYRDELPGVEEVGAALEQSLSRLEAPPEYITFSGNGEPTLHPDFDRIVDLVIEVRDRSAEGVRTAVLSNSTAAGEDRVARALSRIDVRIMKLDAGNDRVLGLINRPASGITVESVVQGLKGLEGIVLQSVFVDGEVSNCGEKDVEDWLRRVEEIRPAEIQVYSLENAPAMSALRGVPMERLRDIADRAQGLTGIPTHPY